MSPKNTAFVVNDFAIETDDFAAVETIIIDDFEEGNPDNYWGYVNQAEKNDTTLISPGLDGTNRRWQHDDFVNVHLTGANAKDRGPQPGDIFEFWFRIDNISGSPVIDRFEFAATSVDDPQLYRVEFEANTSEPEFQFEKVDGNSRPELVTDPGVEFRQGQNYSVTIKWKVGNNMITAQAFEEPNHNPFSQEIGFSEPGPGPDYENPGINLFTNQNNRLSWDEIRIIP